MQITNAQYSEQNSLGQKVIIATINGTEMSVPLDPANTDYAEIMRQQSEGLLTIADAD